MQLSRDNDQTRKESHKMSRDKDQKNAHISNETQFQNSFFSFHLQK